MEERREETKEQVRMKMMLTTSFQFLSLAMRTIEKSGAVPANYASREAEIVPDGPLASGCSGKRPCFSHFLARSIWSTKKTCASPGEDGSIQGTE